MRTGITIVAVCILFAAGFMLRKGTEPKKVEVVLKTESGEEMSFLLTENNLMKNEEAAVAAIQSGKDSAAGYTVDGKFATPKEYDKTGINSFFLGDDGKVYYIDAGKNAPEKPTKTPPGDGWGEY